MTSGKDTASFFENGTNNQFEYCLKMYPQVLKLKAEKRCKKPQELIRLDQWYQNELPKLIKQRGKDAHMIYDELVQTMKWKQSRGKFYPQLSYLVKVNTPRAVMQETKKAFRKLPNLEQAITALSNLKGVGTTMASALLAAAAPDRAPFMADECLMAIPEIEGIDYTTKEYLNFVQHIQATTVRLNSEAGGDIPVWSPHRVELALWTHYVASDLSPELLDDMPGSRSLGTNGTTTVTTNTGDNETDVDEDTMPGDEATCTGTATESETDNPIDEPSSTTEVALLNNEMMIKKTSTTVKIGNNSMINSDNDADSNFVSNDSTSQDRDPIIDENTTQTTATTTTDDGGTPLASDSESNMEAPAPPLSHITAPTIIRTSNKTQLTATINNGNGAITGHDDTEEEDGISCFEDTNSYGKTVTPIININDATNDSTATTTLSSAGKRSLNCDSSEDQSNSQPEIKKVRSD